jgi:putative endonuclease
VSPSGRQALGDHGEALVEQWYAEQGYELLERKWRHSAGEIDLVVRRGRVVAFCEVKTRTGDRFGTGAEAVNGAKQRRIRTAASAYLGVTPLRFAVVRFDVACVRGKEVEVIEAAF